MSKEYISALADALIKHGRRYGLSSTYRNHLIEILTAVPAPVEKSECCRDNPSTQRCGGAEAACIRPLGEVAAELRESDPSLPKVIQSAVDAGKAAREALAKTLPTGSAIGSVPATVASVVPDGLDAASATVAFVEETPPTVQAEPEVKSEDHAKGWRNTGGLPEGAPDDYKKASKPAVGFSITGLAQGKGTK